MRFLIAIKNTSKESKNILHIGMNIASAFNADISVIYVGWKVRGLNEKDISLTRDSLAEWDIFHPGVEVLEWAFNTLKELGFLRDDGLKFYPKNLVLLFVFSIMVYSFFHGRYISTHVGI